mmetsp:Transcript_27544/g.45185  ORF Transcript_27544/g.45185 Transcript_27544/m.45185 type:complete len:139 (-) Transcript_27544:154-570(-)
MINILSKNDSKKNTDAYPMNVVKEMLQNVIANRNKILEKVGIERAELYNDMEAALSRAKCNTKSSKLTHAEGLVDVWLVLKNIPSLVDGSGGVATQTKSLDTYIGLQSGVGTIRKGFSDDGAADDESEQSIDRILTET